MGNDFNQVCSFMGTADVKSWIITKQRCSNANVYEAVLREHVYISSHLLFRTEFSRKFFIACLQFVSL